MHSPPDRRKTTMTTNNMMALRALVEKSSDVDLLLEMIGFTAERLMALEAEGLAGAAQGERSQVGWKPQLFARLHVAVVRPTARIGGHSDATLLVCENESQILCRCAGVIRVADWALPVLAGAEWRKEGEGLMARLAACSCSCLGPLQRGLSRRRRPPATPLYGLEGSGG